MCLRLEETHKNDTDEIGHVSKDKSLIAECITHRSLTSILQVFIT